MRTLLLYACLPLLAGSGRAPAPARIETSPSQVKLRLGGTAQLQARLKGRQGRVEWSVAGDNCGAVSPTGLYHAPAQGATPATVRVRASLAEDPGLTAQTIVFIEAVSVSVRPSISTLQTGETAQLRAKVGGADDQRVRWSVEGGPGAGSISESGYFTAPARFLTPGTVTIRATSVADPTKSDTGTVRIAAVRIQVSPEQVTLRHGRSERFEAKVAGTANPAVEWKVLGSGMGTITPAGVYNTPPQMTTPAIAIVVATSVADPTKTASARVRVDPVDIRAGRAPGKRRRGGLARTAGSVLRTVVGRVTRIYLPFNPLDAVVPGPSFRGRSGKQYVPLGGAASLHAVVTGSTNQRVLWELEGTKIGEISEDGVYRAPQSLTTPQVVRVRGSSAADPTKAISFELHLPPVVVEAERSGYTCHQDEAVQLRARVENSEDDRIEWSVEGGDRLGTVSETGLYQPPPVMSTPAQVNVRAASAADPTKFAMIRIEVPELRLELSPDETELAPGRTVRFRARRSRSSAPADVLWRLTPEVGAISPDGVYRAPDDAGTQVVQVTAVLRADPTKTATATLRIRRR